MGSCSFIGSLLSKKPNEPFVIQSFLFICFVSIIDRGMITKSNPHQALLTNTIEIWETSDMKQTTESDEKQEQPDIFTCQTKEEIEFILNDLMNNRNEESKQVCEHLFTIQILNMTF